MKKEMLINVLQPEECRIAIVEDGILEELYVERTSLENYTGNIYKGKIVNIEPSIQAAFVDFSVGRNGFLHVSDVEPQYYRGHIDEEAVLGPRDRSRDPRRTRERPRDRPEPENRQDLRYPDNRHSAPPLDDELTYLPENLDESDDDLFPEAEPPRDRERERPFGANLFDADPFTSPRSRERDRGDSSGPSGRDRPRGRDRDRERDRPDRSEKPRRERTIRRFGEGLTDDPFPRSTPPPPALPAPSDLGMDLGTPAPYTPAASSDRPTPAEPPTESGRSRRSWPEADSPWEPGPESEISWQGRSGSPAPSGRSETRDLREGSEDEPTPTGRSGRSRASSRGSERSTEPEDIESFLPPSRTQRSRPSTPRPEPREERGATEPPSGRRSRPSRESRGPDSPSADLFAPEPGAIEAEDLSFNSPGYGDSGELGSAPPRRGGRDAIRARAGGAARTPERPREPAAPPPPARPIEPPVEPELPRSRGRAVEPEAPRAREKDRERTRFHDRAGEPGYVPRRERVRPREDEFTEWSSAESTELEPETSAGAFADFESESETDSESDRPRRRRRRRRSRREGGREEVESGSPRRPHMDMEDDEELEPETREVLDLSSREIESTTLADDFDFVDRGHDHDDDEDDDEFEGRRTPFVDEEIEPELQEEIAREIHEIRELEREMGLRGPVEARPRRGEPAGDDFEDEEEGGRGGRGGRPRSLVKPPIQEVFRRGDEVLVQVIKESIGTKGPTLSTYISIPGRYLVLMPGLNRVGVSRKIADEGQRRRLRQIMNELNPPKGLGFIVRTAGLDRTKRELARDLAYLLRLWKVILRRIKRAKAPAPIYQESDMIIRTIRDIFSGDIDTVWIDEPTAFERAQEFMRVVMPKFVDRIKLYQDRIPLFHRFGLEEEIAKIQRRQVPLPEGGSIVIEQTEALVAIDVNSGNFRVEDDAERTAYEMNLRAAREIARQLRLRDLGGVIVNDFIDMRDEKHRRGVERALREAVRRDRARTKILRMSQFGIIEMTRQRIRPSLKRSVYTECEHCTGAGLVKSVESMAIDVMRAVAFVSHRTDVHQMQVQVSAEVATYISNRKRKELADIEAACELSVQIVPVTHGVREHLQVNCVDHHGNELPVFPAAQPALERAPGNRRDRGGRGGNRRDRDRDRPREDRD